MKEFHLIPDANVVAFIGTLELVFSQIIFVTSAVWPIKMVVWGLMSFVLYSLLSIHFQFGRVRIDKLVIMDSCQWQLGMSDGKYFEREMKAFFHINELAILFFKHQKSWLIVTEYSLGHAQFRELMTQLHGMDKQNVNSL